MLNNNDETYQIMISENFKLHVIRWFYKMLIRKQLQIVCRKKILKKKFFFSKLLLNMYMHFIVNLLIF